MCIRDRILSAIFVLESSLSSSRAINIRTEIDYKRFVGQYSLMKPTEKGCVKPHKNV